jgi:uncharacterized membrane protein
MIKKSSYTLNNSLMDHNMDSLHFTPKNSILLLTTLLTGLLSGIFFTWTNAVTLGIGRLNDISYLQVFQHMNQITILNPLFYIIIIGSLLLTFLTAYLYRSNTGIILGLLIAAVVFYFLGVFMVTMIGNIPLNEMLDKTNLTKISLDEAKILREKFETQWNNLNLIRTISSIMSFLFLILVCLFRKRH